MWFGIYLVRKGKITSEQYVDAIDRQLRSRPPLGELAIELGKLRVAQVFQVLGEQAVTQRPFGEIAMQLGFLDSHVLAGLLMAQEDRQQPLTDALIANNAIDRETAEAEFAAFRSRKNRSRESA